MLNEEAELPATLQRMQTVPEIGECIVVDCGSKDQTRRIATEAGCKVITSRRGRGTQFQAGFENSRGNILLLLHADTWLPANAGHAIDAALSNLDVVGGGFWKVFREPHWLMRGSSWRCWTRLHLFGRVAGDQAMFVRREALERVGGVPDVPIMEEFELCRRLRRIGRLALAPATVRTSARRWQQQGVLRTYLRMHHLVVLYYLGTPLQALAERYDVGWRD